MQERRKSQNTNSNRRDENDGSRRRPRKSAFTNFRMRPSYRITLRAHMRREHVPAF